MAWKSSRCFKEEDSEYIQGGYRPNEKNGFLYHPPNVDSSMQSAREYKPLADLHLDLTIKLDPEIQAYIDKKIKEFLDENH